MGAAFGANGRVYICIVGQTGCLMRILLLVLLLAVAAVGDEKGDAARKEASRRAKVFNESQAASANIFGEATKSGAFLKYQKKGKAHWMIVGEPFHELSEQQQNTLATIVFQQKVSARPNLTTPLMIYERKDDKDVKLGTYWWGKQSVIWETPKDKK